MPSCHYTCPDMWRLEAKAASREADNDRWTEETRLWVQKLAVHYMVPGGAAARLLQCLFSG